MRKIGQGSHCTVYQLDKHRALKEYSLDQPTRAITAAFFSQTLSHPNIITTHSITYAKKRIIIIQDLAKTDLETYLVRKSHLTMEERTTFIYQLLLATNFLHAQRVIHGDLKPSNVLIHNNRCQITDFSLSTLFDKQVNYVCGSPQYRAPEVYNREPWNYKVDIWALGCLCYRILHGRELFGHPDTVAEEQRRGVVNNTLVGTDPWTDLIRQMLNPEPRERPDTETLLFNPLFSTFQPSPLITWSSGRFSRLEIYQNLFRTGQKVWRRKILKMVVADVVRILLFGEPPLPSVHFDSYKLIITWLTTDRPRWT